MDIDLILNELSLQQPAPNQEVAKQWMSCLIKTTAVFQYMNHTMLLWYGRPRPYIIEGGRGRPPHSMWSQYCKG
ncbi:hypothetical protein WA1_01120 [Scytonema hofmannii PCC 7110]|uniref:Uncharacterized protein n=1 Tax=Scytonema hofmannii PCC 7110 TaxID=128403 RepID=A0A139XGG8_9CYAN|nr:hypothetical protein [Scytonema hofmannii]KYC43794.1 hypothetical protein WA1_01120 [Scytonema hofmannii PCC 7110]